MGAEGKAVHLAFGLSPFCGVAPHTGDLPWLRALFQTLWAANLESVYSIRGLAAKKAHHCAGQGTPLHDRLIAGHPEYAFSTTVRFTMLLCTRGMIRRLPSAVVEALARRAERAARRLARAVWTRASRCVGR